MAARRTTKTTESTSTEAPAAEADENTGPAEPVADDQMPPAEADEAAPEPDGPGTDGKSDAPDSDSSSLPAEPDDEDSAPPGDDRPCREHFPTGWPTADGVTSVGCEHGSWSREVD
jgi:hypothetical protein